MVGSRFLRYFTLAFLFSIMLFASGCAQTSIPAACAGLPENRLSNCIYIQAVSEQNPFYCYSISDTSQRATCMRHASDPAMKKTLQNSKASDVGGIFAKQEEPPAPPVETIPEPQVGCESKSGKQKDECFRTEATSKSDIHICEKVSDKAILEACISQIARKTKDLESCKALFAAANRDLCRLYAKGETP